jgi:hypothetical protein
MFFFFEVTAQYIEVEEERNTEDIQHAHIATLQHTAV